MSPRILRKLILERPPADHGWVTCASNYRSAMGGRHVYGLMRKAQSAALPHASGALDTCRHRRWTGLLRRLAMAPQTSEVFGRTLDFARSIRWICWNLSLLDFHVFSTDTHTHTHTHTRSPHMCMAKARHVFSTTTHACFTAGRHVFKSNKARGHS